jgi:hypothetical protein
MLAEVTTKIGGDRQPERGATDAELLGNWF